MQISRTSALSTPPIRAARKSEWLRCALAHHVNSDPGVENEIVVLATGIDQYLQEIFHHLAFYNNDDLVSEEDFRLLCLVLGLTTEGNQTEKYQTEGHDICYALPPVLNFREFHSRLCGFFTIKAQNGTTATRLPVTEETEHIEREIRLRWPRVRRRKCVSFDLSRDLKVSSVNAFEKTVNLKAPAEESSNASGLESQQRARQEQVEMENASLRELVEDLRSALQSSDARCMALEVALRRAWPMASRRSSVAGVDPHVVWASGRTSRRRTRDLRRELELIRASRDGQLEEAMRFNQRLEEELAKAYAEAGRLGGVLGRTRRESAEIRRRAEEARGALAAGLERVRELQRLAEQIGPLREKTQNLKRELETFRSRCTCRAACERRPELTEGVEPTGQGERFINGEEGLQRAVEGRAASDEEEEERDEQDEQCCLLEVKQLINRLHKCAKGCQKSAVCHLVLSQSAGLYDDQCGCGVARGEETFGCRYHRPLHEKVLEKDLEKDLQQKQEEVDGLFLEVQMVETERVRLSLLEEKLTEALSLLLRLRDKRVSRRALGKLLLDTLDLCSRRDSGMPCSAPDLQCHTLCRKMSELPSVPTASDPVFQVVDILCQQLTCSELLYASC